MKVYRDVSSDENRRFWRSVDAAAERVSQWPAWKRGDNHKSPPQQPTRTKEGRRQIRHQED